MTKLSGFSYLAFLRVIIQNAYSVLLVRQLDRINRHIQHFEYESFPIVCFKHRIYGHNSKLCPGQQVPMSGVEEEHYGSWMIVERRQKGKGQSLRTVVGEKHCNRTRGSRFSVLDEVKEEIWDEVLAVNEGPQLVKAKGKGVIVGSGPRIGLKVIGNNNAAGRAPSTARLGSFDDRYTWACKSQLDRKRIL
ncbi:hypothetical protein Gohar_027303 [Gossypium harknessii]|uniref:DUF4283 domain-containing protein n=1 Tax=Gossypium harknessii TaxID=34285 RepID=A0A7J9HUE9_9ROSI|nr:hypothetical protein [Gossypium harknessii]